MTHTVSGAKEVIVHHTHNNARQKSQELPPVHQMRSSPHPIRCRYGATGDGRDMIDGLNTVQCDTCSFFVHIACQLDGRASNLPRNANFKCDECSGRNMFPAYMFSQRCVSVHYANQFEDTNVLEILHVSVIQRLSVEAVTERRLLIV